MKWILFSTHVAMAFRVLLDSGYTVSYVFLYSTLFPHGGRKLSLSLEYFAFWISKCCSNHVLEWIRRLFVLQRNFTFSYPCTYVSCSLNYEILKPVI